ncbi:MAG: pyrroline-5-carboxylate reductase [Candidatus Poribacteria bacterium]|nr:pyrroline-5-carboxylate reductase [Candidatus Poribacteria bacterium]
MLDGEFRLGIIGVGGMGEAILRGIVGNLLMANQVWVSDIVEEKVDSLCEELDVNKSENIVDLVDNVDCVLYAAKPGNVPTILPEVADVFQSSDQWLLSIAAGVPTATFESYFSSPTSVVRVMPNLAVTAKAAICVIARGNAVADEHIFLAETLFNALGNTMVREEKMLDAVTALSGSGPGFVFLFIEALADAGVHIGLARDDAYQLAVHTVLGASKLLSETGEHPAVLKNLVTTPAGTTTAGLHELERGGLRAMMTEAVAAARRRAEELANS